MNWSQADDGVVPEALIPVFLHDLGAKIAIVGSIGSDVTSDWCRTPAPASAAKVSRESKFQHRLVFK